MKYIDYYPWGLESWFFVTTAIEDRKYKELSLWATLMSN